MTRGTLAAVLGAFALLAPWEPARAQELDEALRRYEQADFDGALALTEAALLGDALDARRAARALELLALARRGTGDAPGARRALEDLAVVARDHRFAEEAPPSFVREHRALVESMAPLRVETEVRPGPVVVLRATPRGDGWRVVREARVHARVAGQSWRTAVGEIEVRVGPGERLEYFTELVGPGGAVVARDASARAPRVWSRGALSPDPAPESDGGDAWWLLWMSLGIVAASAVVAVVLLTTASDDTAVSGPRVAF